MQFYCTEYGDVRALLTTHWKDPYAVQRACVELSRLILARHAVRLEMIEDAQLLPLLVEIVADHVEDEDLVVAFCCRFLRRTIVLRAPSDLDVQTKITETGILNVMAKAMQYHSRSTALSIEVCRLASLLCFDMPFAPHVDNQSDITTAGLFQAICERLQMETSEPEVQHGVEAVLAIVYEHVMDAFVFMHSFCARERNAEVAIETLSVLPILSKLLDRFPSSSRLIQSITQTLFQLTTLQPSIQRELVDLGIVAQVVEFVHGCADGENEGATTLVLWHVFKLLELCIRQNDVAKDAVCAGEGPLAMITATQRIRGSASAKKHEESSQCHALYYVACMLFCRVAVAGAPTFAGTAVHPARIALVVVQSAGDAVHVTGQAIRLLELIATIDANRIPLTRLGASRAVKVVYNSATTTHALQVLCERAIATIEGT